MTCDSMPSSVVATTVLAGNTYTSAPQAAAPGTKFLAQVVQNTTQGTYEFQVVQSHASDATVLEFEKTSLAPVTFRLSAVGVPLQSVVVSDSFMAVRVIVGELFFHVVQHFGCQLGTEKTTFQCSVVARCQSRVVGYHVGLYFSRSHALNPFICSRR